MQHRALAAGLAGLAIGIAIGVVAAQPVCTLGDASCIQLPIVQAANDCVTSEPPGVDRPRVWLTRYTVVPGAPLLACVVDDELSPNLTVHAVLHQTSGDTQTAPVAIDVISGRATISIPTAAFSPGELIAVEVVEMATTSPQAHLLDRLFVLVREPAPTPEP